MKFTKTKIAGICTAAIGTIALTAATAFASHVDGCSVNWVATSTNQVVVNATCSGVTKSYYGVISVASGCNTAANNNADALKSMLSLGQGAFLSGKKVSLDYVAASGSCPDYLQGVFLTN